MPFRFRRSFKLLRGTRLDLGDNGLRASLGRRRHPVTLTARGLRTRRAPPAPLPSVSLPVYPIIGMTCGLLALCLCLLASGGLVFGVTHLPVRATRTPAPPTATRVPTGTPTATRAPTLTPLPGQVYSMTQAARLKVTPYAPVFFKTETPTLISALTKTRPPT